MSLDDDLATLRHMAERFGYVEGVKAVDRVEDEIKRLGTDNECLVIERNAADEEVARLRAMVREHHASLAAVGGGPCICDICKAKDGAEGGTRT